MLAYFVSFMLGAWVGCGIGILFMCMLQLRKDDFNEYDFEIQQAIDTKNKVDFLYKKYISLAKKSSEDNLLSPFDFAGNARKIFERNSIIAKLEILQEILGYDYDRIKHDIERTE